MALRMRILLKSSLFPRRVIIPYKPLAKRLFSSPKVAVPGNSESEAPPSDFLTYMAENVNELSPDLVLPPDTPPSPKLSATLLPASPSSVPGNQLALEILKWRRTMDHDSLWELFTPLKDTADGEAWNVVIQGVAGKNPDFPRLENVVNELLKSNVMPTAGTFQCVLPALANGQRRKLAEKVIFEWFPRVYQRGKLLGLCILHAKYHSRFILLIIMTF
jgi:hypothetical protein